MLFLGLIAWVLLGIWGLYSTNLRVLDKHLFDLQN